MQLLAVLIASSLDDDALQRRLDGPFILPNRIAEDGITCK
jgi:hypothetical protein